MDISDVMNIIYKDLINLDKVAPYILGAFVLIVFAIRNVYAYKFSINYQGKFGIPYYRFNSTFDKSLISTIWYIVMLLLFIVLQYIFAVNHFQINAIMCAICCAIFVAGYNFVILTPLSKKASTRYVWFVTIIITLFVMAAFVISIIYFPITREDYNFIENCLIIYSVLVLLLYFVYLLVSFSYSIYKSFGKHLQPKDDYYEVITINDNKYAILFNTKEETIVIKLKDENGTLRIVKSDYMMVKSVDDKKIEYLKIKL